MRCSQCARVGTKRDNSQVVSGQDPTNAYFYSRTRKARTALVRKPASAWARTDPIIASGELGPHPRRPGTRTLMSLGPKKTSQRLRWWHAERRPLFSECSGKTCALTGIFFGSHARSRIAAAWCGSNEPRECADGVSKCGRKRRNFGGLTSSAALELPIGNSSPVRSCRPRGHEERPGVDRDQDFVNDLLSQHQYDVVNNLHAVHATALISFADSLGTTKARFRAHRD